MNKYNKEDCKMIINHIKHAIFTKFAVKIRVILESAKGNGRNY